MKIYFKREEEVLTVYITGIYDIFTIDSVHELVKEPKNFEGIEKVVVDCTKLETIDSFGWEIFLIRKNYNIETIEFTGNDESLYIFNYFSQLYFSEDIVRKQII